MIFYWALSLTYIGVEMAQSEVTRFRVLRIKTKYFSFKWTSEKNLQFLGVEDRTKFRSLISHVKVKKIGNESF